MLHRIPATLALGLLFACSIEEPESRVPPPSPETVSKTAPAEVDVASSAGKTVKHQQPRTDEKTVTDDPANATRPPTTAIATFGAGCFWCVEAVLEQLEGVKSVESGYMGGDVKDPTYREVCTGRTGHAEVVRVTFDPAVISYKTLLKWFFKLHDPTTLNRQGADAGTQYRSAIFYHSEEQKAAAERAKKLIDDGKVFPDPVVTEITKATEYYPADGDHQDYYRLNKQAGYCRVVIAPKLDKLGLEK